MDIQTAGLLARYNKKTNQEMDSLIASLGPEEWKKEYGGYFPSVQAVCNHLCIADFNWLKRFGGIRRFTYLENSFFDRVYTFASTAVERVDQYLELRPLLDEEFLKMAGELTAHDLTQTLSWTTSRGDPQARNFGGILLHVFNHQTHHRGMTSLYLEFLGKPNDFANLMYLV